MKLTDLGFWNTPMGARPVTGARDELGNPVYQDVAGNQFNVMPAPAQEQGPGLLDMLAGIYRLAGGRGSEQDQAAATGLLGAVTQGLTAPGRAAQGEMVTNGDVWSTALDYGVMGAPMAAPEGAIRANSFRAFHGSPHTFDRFDLSKIGTGEGAQAYGHGLYFAQSEDVARGYRDALTPDFRQVLSYAGPDRARNAASMLAADIPEKDILSALADLGAASPEDALSQGRDILNSARNAGSMYEVQINADPNAFLNWDAPLSDNSPLRGVVGDYAATAMNSTNAMDRNWGKDATLAARSPDITGQGAYYQMTRLSDANRDILANTYGDAAYLNSPSALSAQVLRDNGIPGIQYLDAGSRAAGDGSRNFVVFDDKIIDILRRYGIGSAAIGGGWAMTPEDAQAVNDMGLLNGT
jgi:hypothetical protein